MGVIKPERRVNDKWLWQSDESGLKDDIFDQENGTTLVFGVFYFDELVQDSEQLILKSQLQELISMLEPWNKSYPWNSFNGVTLEIREYLSGEYYIFGSLHMGDNARDEEALVLSILLNFSRRVGPCTFIKVCDTDGEFILMEANDVIPEELEYPISNNRIWITMGRLKYIPTTFYFDRGLSKIESISYLKKENSKLLPLPNIETKIRESFLNVFPNSALDKLNTTTITVSDPEVAAILKNDPKIVSLAVSHFMSSTYDIPISHSNEVLNDKINLTIPSAHAALVKKYTQMTGKGENHEKTLSEILETSILHMLANGILEKTTTGKKSQEDLQTVLRDSYIISQNYELKPIDWELLDTNEKSDIKVTSLDTLKTSLMSFLNEESDLTGIINDEREVKHNNEDNPNAESESDLGLDSDPEIDEDDFFEFFLKEGLNLSDNYIENLRNHNENPPKSTKEDRDADSQRDLQSSSNEISEYEDSIEDLIKSLSVDGAPLGPLKTILENYNGR